jgi:putative transposase
LGRLRARRLITATPDPRQYTAVRYATRLAEAGAVASIGSVGDSYHAMAESVIGLYKLERVRRDGRSAASMTSNWPPRAGPTGSTTTACTA